MDVVITLGLCHVDARAPLNVPSIVKGTLLECLIAFDAVKEIIAFLRMRKKVGNMRQTFVSSRWRLICYLKWKTKKKLSTAYTQGKICHHSVAQNVFDQIIFQINEFAIKHLE